MKTIHLPDCCPNCFEALNGEPHAIDSQAEIDAIAASSKALSTLADCEGVTTLHTGEWKGFSWSVCGVCESPLGGDRYALIGLAPSMSGER